MTVLVCKWVYAPVVPKSPSPLGVPPRHFLRQVNAPAKRSLGPKQHSKDKTIRKRTKLPSPMALLVSREISWSEFGDFSASGKSKLNEKSLLMVPDRSLKMPPVSYIYLRPFIAAPSVWYVLQNLRQSGSETITESSDEPIKGIHHCLVSYLVECRDIQKDSRRIDICRGAPSEIATCITHPHASWVVCLFQGMEFRSTCFIIGLGLEQIMYMKFPEGSSVIWPRRSDTELQLDFSYNLRSCV